MKVLEVLQFIDTSTAAGIDEISGTFLKNSANILAKNLQQKHVISPLQGFSQVTASLLS